MTEHITIDLIHFVWGGL